MRVNPALFPGARKTARSSTSGDPGNPDFPGGGVQGTARSPARIHGTEGSLPSQNQEMTSGTLYSVFKEPDPGAHPRTTPFFRRPRFENSARRRNFIVSQNSSPPSTIFPRNRPSSGTARARRAFERTRNPCREAQYRPARNACQAVSRKREKANDDGPSRSSVVHTDLCRSRVRSSSRAPKALARSPPGRLRVPARGSSRRACRRYPRIARERSSARRSGRCRSPRRRNGPCSR